MVQRRVEWWEYLMIGLIPVCVILNFYFRRKPNGWFVLIGIFFIFVGILPIGLWIFLSPSGSFPDLEEFVSKTQFLYGWHYLMNIPISSWYLIGGYHLIFIIIGCILLLYYYLST